jgi:hypothetical protein
MSPAHPQEADSLSRWTGSSSANHLDSVGRTLSRGSVLAVGDGETHDRARRDREADRVGEAQVDAASVENQPVGPGLVPMAALIDADDSENESGESERAQRDGRTE